MTVRTKRTRRGDHRVCAWTKRGPYARHGGAFVTEPTRRRNEGLRSGRDGGRRDDGRRPRDRSVWFPGTRRLSAARLASPTEGVSSPGRPVRITDWKSVALPLSYAPTGWGRWDSNPRRTECSLTASGRLPSKRTLPRCADRTSSDEPVGVARRDGARRRCFARIEPAVLAAGFEPALSFDPGSKPGG
jgi:hypothetical protein